MGVRGIIVYMIRSAEKEAGRATDEIASWRRDSRKHNFLTLDRRNDITYGHSSWQTHSLSTNYTCSHRRAARFLVNLRGKGTQPRERSQQQTATTSGFTRFHAKFQGGAQIRSRFGGQGKRAAMKSRAASATYSAQRYADGEEAAARKG